VLNPGRSTKEGNLVENQRGEESWADIVNDDIRQRNEE